MRHFYDCAVFHSIATYGVVFVVQSKTSSIHDWIDVLLLLLLCYSVSLLHKRCEQYESHLQYQHQYQYQYPRAAFWQDTLPFTLCLLPFALIALLRSFVFELKESIYYDNDGINLVLGKENAFPSKSAPHRILKSFQNSILHTAQCTHTLSLSLIKQQS